MQAVPGSVRHQARIQTQDFLSSQSSRVTIHSAALSSNYKKERERQMSNDMTPEQLLVCYDTEDLIMLFKELEHEGYPGLSLGLIIDLIIERCSEYEL
jgi:hypothetical protein